MPKYTALSKSFKLFKVKFKKTLPCTHGKSEDNSQEWLPPSTVWVPQITTGNERLYLLSHAGSREPVLLSFG